MNIYHNTKPGEDHDGGLVDMRGCFLTVLFLFVLFFLWSCAGPQRMQSENVTPPERAQKKTVPAPQEELLEIVIPQRGEETYVGKQKVYTLQMRDAEINDLLLAFSEQAGLNIVIDRNITGSVTVDLKKVTLKQALDSILFPLGLEYTKEGNFIKVFKPSIETQTFSLNYITTARTGQGLVSGAIGGRRQTEGAGGGAGTQRQSGSGGYSEVSSRDETDLWGEIGEGLNSLKSLEGKVILNKASNTVVVIDYPLYIDRIADYLATIEGAVHRQVIIEASIIEVSLDDQYQAGVNWRFIQSLPQMSNFQWGLADDGLDSLLGYPGSTGGDEGSGSSGSTQSIPNLPTIRPFSGIFRIGMQDQTIFLTDIMEALSTQGDVSILSNPRISTLNNQPAIIKVAKEDVYFQTTRSTNYGESTTETNVNFITVGIVLSVTPQISSDGIITMTIHPSITEKSGEKTSSLGDTVPIIDVRETETVVRVNNGETILIGGLMQDKVTEAVVGLPVLKDLPVLGNVFKHVKREKSKTELVIMLTPKLLFSGNINRMSSYERERFKKLRSK